MNVKSKKESDMKFDIFTKLWNDDSGATAIEYGLIAALVSVAAIGALQAMGGSLTTIFTNVSDTLATAVAGS